MIEVLADPSQPPVATMYAVPSPWVARTRSGETVVFDDVTARVVRSRLLAPATARLDGSPSAWRRARSPAPR